MKKLIIFLMVILTNIIFSQTKNGGSSLITISKNCKIGFTTYDKEFKLYQEPFILKGNKKYKIIGYDNNNYSGAKILSKSPNKKYIVLDYISKGYVNDGTNKILYENYLCVIVDVCTRKVVLEIQSDCGGSWNKKNQWVNNEKIIFESKY